MNAVLVKWAAKYKVPIIASNDSHYVDQQDANAHDILLCINTGEKQSTPKADDGDEEGSQKGKRFAFPNDEFFFKTTTQMATVFSDLPEALRGMSAPALAAEAGPLDRLWRGELNLDALERLIIEEAMQRSRGVQTEAARLLGISRRTLQYRLEKHGLSKPADE